MTRYYNENPQVTLWREKCAMLEKEIALLHKKLADATFEAERWEYEYDELNLEASKWCGKLEEEIKEKIEAFKHFNSLPWYKKMFYKFKV